MATGNYISGERPPLPEDDRYRYERDHESRNNGEDLESTLYKFKRSIQNDLENGRLRGNGNEHHKAEITVYALSDAIKFISKT